MVVTSLVSEESKVILVHDYLLVMRGAERTFEAITQCFPDAPVATLLYDPVRTEGRFENRRVRTSFLQPFVADQERFRRSLPLLPFAAESLPVKDFPLVISSSSAFAHGVRPARNAVHISYCHSPFRYIWHERDRTERSVPVAARRAGRAALGALRQWDLRAASRVSGFLANSELTRQRIADFYGRESVVVHPPVDIGRFTSEPDPRDYLLMVGEVTPHKNLDIGLLAAEKVGIKVKVVGAGPHLAELSQRFRHAEFLGRVDDRRLSDLYSGCKALMVPAVEEFGITMVEAQAAGRPVVAAARGGALEIVTDGVTGVLVPPRSVDALAQALRATDWESFDVDALRSSASRFSLTHFQRRFEAAVTLTLARTAEVQELTAATSGPPRLSRPHPVRATGLVRSSIPGGSIARSRNRP